MDDLLSFLFSTNILSHQKTRLFFSFFLWIGESDQLYTAHASLASHNQDTIVLHFLLWLHVATPTAEMEHLFLSSSITNLQIVQREITESAASAS